MPGCNTGRPPGYLLYMAGGIGTVTRPSGTARTMTEGRLAWEH